jgi:CDGSH-type Zn-finger protein
MTEGKKCKIKVVKNGPYLVSGNVPLFEKTIIPKGNGFVFTDIKEYESKSTYGLCRCGNSKNPPFCDGAHVKENFDGSETASKDTYLDRADVICGPDLDLYDDNRCALAKFCHREIGDAWELTEESNEEVKKEEAIIAAKECPAGRLTAKDKDGNFIEPKHEAAIDVLQGPIEGNSGGLSVKGYIELEAADGTVYELRNRYVLCRCGKSSNKPFCDATHVICQFVDK